MKTLNATTYQFKLPPRHFSGAREIELTTLRAESSYGYPVAILHGGPHDGKIFGPNDQIPAAGDDSLNWFFEPASHTVALAYRAYREANSLPLYDGNEHPLIRRFCYGER